MTNVVTASVRDAAGMRRLTPAQRYAAALEPADTRLPDAPFTVANRHDQELLYYQLEAEQLLQAWRWLTNSIVAIGEGPNRLEGPRASIASTSS